MMYTDEMNKSLEIEDKGGEKVLKGKHTAAELELITKNTNISELDLTGSKGSFSNVDRSDYFSHAEDYGTSTKRNPYIDNHKVGDHMLSSSGIKVNNLLVSQAENITYETFGYESFIAMSQSGLASDIDPDTHIIYGASGYDRKIITIENDQVHCVNDPRKFGQNFCCIGDPGAISALCQKVNSITNELAAKELIAVLNQRLEDGDYTPEDLYRVELLITNRRKYVVILIPKLKVIMPDADDKELRAQANLILDSIWAGYDVDGIADHKLTIGMKHSSVTNSTSRLDEVAENTRIKSKGTGFSYISDFRTAHRTVPILEERREGLKKPLADIHQYVNISYNNHIRGILGLEKLVIPDVDNIVQSTNSRKIWDVLGLNGDDANAIRIELRREVIGKIEDHVEKVHNNSFKM